MDEIILKKREKALLIIVIMILFFSITPRIILFFDIDKCLDNGGSFDYEKCECDYNKNYLFRERDECY